MEAVEEIAEAVLYEGYLLFPYRRSALKKQQRWTFGGVYPRQFGEASGGDDPWSMQTQCLVLGDTQTTLDIRVRFLQVVDCQVAQLADGEMQSVDELSVGEQTYRPWEEATERTIDAGALRLSELSAESRSLAIDIASGSENEPLIDSTGALVGALVRSWRLLHGEIEVRVEKIGEACHRLTVRIANTTPWHGQVSDRPAVIRQTFVSTHTMLHVRGGEFVSLLEPPEEYEAAAKSCRNINVWPVLVGETGERDTMLSSPIILYDYPRISPESQGNYYDATEIDELLALTVLTLTEEEKHEMRSSDPRGREILERTEALTTEQLMSLHGVVRNLQTMKRGRP